MLTKKDVQVIIDTAFEEFAQMMQKSFAFIQEEIQEFRSETNARFDRIENIWLPDHEHRIEHLEDKTKRLEVSLYKRKNT